MGENYGAWGEPTSANPYGGKKQPTAPPQEKRMSRAEMSRAARLSGQFGSTRQEFEAEMRTWGANPADFLSYFEEGARTRKAPGSEYAGDSQSRPERTPPTGMGTPEPQQAPAQQTTRPPEAPETPPVRNKPREAEFAPTTNQEAMDAEVEALIGRGAKSELAVRATLERRFSSEGDKEMMLRSIRKFLPNPYAPRPASR